MKIYSPDTLVSNTIHQDESEHANRDIYVRYLEDLVPDISDPKLNYFDMSRWCTCKLTIRLPQKLLSFYNEIIYTQYFWFYIILLNYVWSIVLQ